MKISVVIVSFNVKEYLKNCLASVKEASKGIDTEIIVVDNNSSDSSVEMVAGEFPEVTLIINNDNRGFAAACNQGIRISHGNYILFLNPDTLIPTDCLQKSIAFMEAHPDAGILGARLIDGDGRFLPESKRSFPSPSTAFFKVTGLNRIFPASHIINRYYYPAVSSGKTGQVDVIPGAFMFIRRQTLGKAGPFDEEYFLYGEDIELSHRITHSGFRNYYCHDIEVTHFKGKSTPRKGFSDILNFYNAMRIWSRKRHREKFSLWHFIIIPSTWLVEAAAIARRLMRR